MSGERWKRAEREIAALLGGVRLPNSGRGQPDVIAGNLAVQVKTRKDLPGWLEDALDQAIRDAEAGQQPVVILNRVSQGQKARRVLVADLAHVLQDTEMAGQADPPQGRDKTGSARRYRT